jgi:transposase InsO family protein
MIVLEGLKGKSVNDICAEYQISQAHYYRWRDKFLANMHQAFKEECLWLREWDNPFELVDELKKWVESYNRNYLHSALGYKTPAQTEIDYYKEKILLKST